MYAIAFDDEIDGEQSEREEQEEAQFNSRELNGRLRDRIVDAGLAPRIGAFKIIERIKCSRRCRRQHVFALVLSRRALVPFGDSDLDDLCVRRSLRFSARPGHGKPIARLIEINSFRN